MDEEDRGGMRSTLARASQAAVSFLIGALALGWIVKQTPLWDPAAAMVYGLVLRSGFMLSQGSASPSSATPSQQVRTEAVGPGVDIQRAGPAAQDRLRVSSADMDLAAHERTSARIDAGAAAKDEQAPSRNTGREPFKTPHLRAGTSFASGTIRYGTSSRSELMGRGAGPVYNFKPNSGAAGPRQLPGDIGAGLREASEKLGETRKAVDSNPHLTAEVKTAIDAPIDDARSQIQSITQP